jgi:aspartate/methionine/tyrosine aminotransferase
LDLINFSRDLFPEVLSMQQIESLLTPEHGYACPDGSVETGRLIRAYESARATRFLRHSDLTARVHVDFEHTAVGIGGGTTGVINCLIPSIRDYYLSYRGTKTPVVVLTVPLYSVYDGIVREHGLRPRYLYTRPESNFLPTPEEVEELLDERPMALILTFPTNPAQSTYGPTRWEELRPIAYVCQKTETFLIVDNVYQDTLWEQGQCNPEIFSLVDTADFISKVFGPSKDRPGCSGFRIGYYCGDPRIREAFFYYSSIQYNTPNSLSRCYLSLDLLFRLLRLEQRTLSKTDLEAIS